MTDTNTSDKSPHTYDCNNRLNVTFIGGGVIDSGVFKNADSVSTTVYSAMLKTRSDKLLGWVIFEITHEPGYVSKQFSMGDYSIEYRADMVSGAEFWMGQYEPGWICMRVGDNGFEYIKVFRFLPEYIPARPQPALNSQELISMRDTILKITEEIKLLADGIKKRDEIIKTLSTKLKELVDLTGCESMKNVVEYFKRLNPYA